MNATCDFLVLYNGRRPEISSELRDGSIAWMVISMAAVALVVFLTRRVRDLPLFNRIRPHVFTRLLGASYALACVAYIVPHVAHGYPCGLELFLHVLVAGMIWAIYSMRALVYIVESEVARLATSSRARGRSNSDATSVPGRRSTVSEVCTSIYHYHAINFNFASVEELTIRDYVRIRKHYMWIFATVFAPQVAVYALVFVIGSKYRECTECPIEPGFIMTVFLSAGLSAVACVGTYRRAFTKGYADAQYILYEIKLMMGLSIFWMVMGYSLEAGDPGEHQFNREFTWRYVLLMWPLSVFIIGVAIPLFKSERHIRHRRFSETLPLQRDSFVTQMGNSPMEYMTVSTDVRNAFDKYAEEHYSHEAAFLKEVMAYRSDMNSSLSSKYEDIDSIMRLYIMDGATRPLNIQAATRVNLIATDYSSMSSSNARSFFDVTFREVEKVVKDGLWIDFINANADLFTEGASSKVGVFDL